MIRIILWVIYNLRKRICLRPSNSLSVISLAWVVGFSSGSQCAHHWAHHWATVLFSSQLSKNSVIGTWMGGGIANATFGGSSVWEMTPPTCDLDSGDMSPKQHYIDFSFGSVGWAMLLTLGKVEKRGEELCIDHFYSLPIRLQKI